MTVASRYQITAAGGIEGSGASVLLSTTPGDVLTQPADLITDFSGEDTVSFDGVQCWRQCQL